MKVHNMWNVKEQNNLLRNYLSKIVTCFPMFEVYILFCNFEITRIIISWDKYNYTMVHPILFVITTELENYNL